MTAGEIARGLTKAQREALMWLAEVGSANGAPWYFAARLKGRAFRELVLLGARPHPTSPQAQAVYAITPLGRAVAQELTKEADVGDVDLEALEASNNARTQGEWCVDGFHTSAVIVLESDSKGYREWMRVVETDSEHYPNPNWHSDAAFVAAAANNMSALIALARRSADLERERDLARAGRDGWEQQCLSAESALTAARARIAEMEGAMRAFGVT